MNPTNQQPESYAFVVDNLGKKKMKVTDMVRSIFQDNRLITIAKLEDNTFVLSIENPISSGRNTQQLMRLTEESFYALHYTYSLYFHAKKIDLEEKLKEFIEKKEINYEYIWRKKLTNIKSAENK